MWGNTGIKRGEILEQNVAKYWHKTWGNTGTKCGEILAQNVGKYWHKMWGNTGIKCGQNFHTEDQHTGVTIKDVVVRYLCSPALSILRLNEGVRLNSTGSV